MTTISVTDDKIVIKAPYAAKELCKAVPGARWDKARKLWFYPRRASVAREIKQIFQHENYIIQKGSQDAFDELFIEGQNAWAASAFKDKVPAKLLAQPLSMTKSWEHQLRAFHFANHQKSIMLAMDMGTGKSKVAVDLCNEKEAMKVLIMCPLSVVNVWPREFKLHSIRPWKIATCHQGTNIARKLYAEQQLALAEIRKEPVAVVINHESAWRGDFGLLIQATDWDVIIVDESHRAKQYNGKFGKFLGNLQQADAFKMCLTGTPMPHSPLDIFSQYRFLNPSIFGFSYNRFKMRYAILGGYLNKEIVGFDNQDELHEKIYSIGFRVTKDEALDLPDEMYVKRESRLAESALPVYAGIEKDFYAKVESGEITAANALVQLLRLQQITSGHVGLDGGGHKWISDHKRKLLEDVLQDIDEPVVVFCRFRPDLAAVREAAAKLKRTYGEISGAQKDLTNDAKMPDDIEVLGVQIQSGGVGIDLTRAAIVIDYSVGFSLGDYLQSRSRVHRPGQGRKVTYIQLVTPGTVDEKVYAALQKREDVIESVLRSRNEKA